MPARESILQQVQRTCKHVAETGQDVVCIDNDALQRLAATLSSDRAAVRASATITRPPLRFTNLEEELTYMCLLNLLDFGSGYDDLLLARGQPSSSRGAHEACEFGCLGLAIHGSIPNATQMQELGTPHAMGMAWGVEGSEEHSVPGLPGVTMTSPTELNAYLGLLSNIMNETGKILEQEGYRSLGAWLLAALEERSTVGLPPSAAGLVEALVETFPGYDDRQGDAVFHRKAQRLVSQLYRRFAGLSDENGAKKFAFEDIDALTVDFSSDVLMAVLTDSSTGGVLQLTDEKLKEAVDNRINLHGDGRLAVWRAAAVEAGRQLTAAVGEGVKSFEVSAALVKQLSESSGGGAMKGPVDKGTLAF